MAYAVKFEDVTKRYPRGWSEGEEPRYASFRHDIAFFGRRLIGRGGARQPHGTLALEDVSLEIQEGESFALMGPNGAGKSTALKLVSRISYPTSGRVRIRGRVAALMEVGLGVHPELTGRENVWLYGQILGLTKADIRRRFDEIVGFAELEKAIDTPVKFFSSGMQLRLGFAIASHLDPDIFVVDEALAVGDAGFAAKCTRRMRSLVQEGRTLILVSHNMAAIEAVCSRGAVLVGGRVVFNGPATGAVAEYLTTSMLAPQGSSESVPNDGAPALRLLSFQATANGGGRVTTGNEAFLRLQWEATRGCELTELSLSISRDGAPPLLHLSSVDVGLDLVRVGPGGLRTDWCMPTMPLAPGRYFVDVTTSLKVEDQPPLTQTLPVGHMFVSAAPDSPLSHLRFAGIVVTDFSIRTATVDDS